MRTRHGRGVSSLPSTISEVLGSLQWPLLPLRGCSPVGMCSVPTLLHSVTSAQNAAKVVAQTQIVFTLWSSLRKGPCLTGLEMLTLQGAWLRDRALPRNHMIFLLPEETTRWPVGYWVSPRSSAISSNSVRGHGSDWCRPQGCTMCVIQIRGLRCLVPLSIQISRVLPQKPPKFSYFYHRRKCSSLSLYGHWFW